MFVPQAPACRLGDPVRESLSQGRPCPQPSKALSLLLAFMTNKTCHGAGFATLFLRTVQHSKECCGQMLLLLGALTCIAPIFSISWSALEAPSKTELTPSLRRHQAGTGGRAELEHGPDTPVPPPAVPDCPPSSYRWRAGAGCSPGAQQWLAVPSALPAAAGPLRSGSCPSATGIPGEQEGVLWWDQGAPAPCTGRVSPNSLGCGSCSSCPHRDFAKPLALLPQLCQSPCALPALVQLTFSEARE